MINEDKIKKSTKGVLINGIIIFSLAGVALLIFIYLMSNKIVLINNQISAKKDSLNLLNDSLLIRKKEIHVLNNFRDTVITNIDRENISAGSALELSSSDKIILKEALKISQGFVFIQVPDSVSEINMKPFISAFKKIGFEVPKVEVVKKFKFKNEVKYFHPEDSTNAAFIKRICDSLYTSDFHLLSLAKTGLSKKASLGQIEVWANNKN